MRCQNSIALLAVVRLGYNCEMWCGTVPASAMAPAILKMNIVPQRPLRPTGKQRKYKNKKINNINLLEITKNVIPAVLSAVVRAQSSPFTNMSTLTVLVLLYGTMKTNGQKCKTYLLMLLTESNILLNF